MFALANALRMTVATDLYGETEFSGHEAQASMRVDPASQSRFEFDRRGLLVARMNACDIPYADGSFDLMFSCSSLEHFGRSDKVLRAMREAHRAIRPGGMYAISVDYLYESDQAHRSRDRRRGPSSEVFTADEVMSLVVDGPGFTLDEEVRFEVDRSQVTNVFDLATFKSESGDYLPHVWLRFGESYLTSLFLVLFKV